MTPPGTAINVVVGVGGTAASFALGDWHTIAGIFAGFATGVFMLVQTWRACRSRRPLRVPKPWLRK
jgi:hypothetical protein